MPALWLRLRAPFAAFRALQAGVYRPTSPVIPYSAAWGLVLNLAGVETRQPAGGVTTLIDPTAPRLRLALGMLRQPEVCVLYQQLHSYPVGSASKNLQPGARGAKYHIAPVRRELLSGFDCVVGVATEERELLVRVVRGLSGTLEGLRYGLPFAGDNNLLFDRIDVLEEPPPARWLTPLEEDAAPRRGSCRLTVGIDRTDNSKTTNLLVAPLEQQMSEPPAEAWIWTPAAPSPV